MPKQKTGSGLDAAKVSKGDFLVMPKQETGSGLDGYTPVSADGLEGVLIPAATAEGGSAGLTAKSRLRPIIVGDSDGSTPKDGSNAAVEPKTAPKTRRDTGGLPLSLPMPPNALQGQPGAFLSVLSNSPYLANRRKSGTGSLCRAN